MTRTPSPSVPSSELVERLRMIRGTQFTPTENALVGEAADEIERLSALEALPSVERLIDEWLSRLPPEHDRTEYAQGKFDVLTDLRAALTETQGYVE